MYHIFALSMNLNLSRTLLIPSRVKGSATLYSLDARNLKMLKYKILKNYAMKLHMFMHTGPNLRNFEIWISTATKNHV